MKITAKLDASDLMELTNPETTNDIIGRAVVMLKELLSEYEQNAKCTLTIDDKDKE